MEEEDSNIRGIKENRPFKLDDPRQKRIFKRLNALLSPGLAKFFFDACKLRSDPSQLYATSHLLAHLFREIESGIRDVSVFPERENVLHKKIFELKERISSVIQFGTSGVKVKQEIFPTEHDFDEALERIRVGVDVDEQKRLTQRWEINTAGKLLKLEKPIIDAWIDLLKEDFFHSQAHRRGLEEPRESSESEHLYEKVEIVFDAVLDAVERSFDEFIEKIDKLIKDGPSEESARILRVKIPRNYVCYNRFFSKNEDSDWLGLLRAQGLFKQPAAIEENKEEGTMRFVSWPQSEYLARMADKSPALVKEIVLEMSDTNNPSVIADLVTVAINLPPKVSVELFERVKKWGSNPYQNLSILDEKLGDLVWYWADNGMNKEALALLEILLLENVRLDAATSNWQFEQFIKKYYQGLIEKVGLPGMVATAEALDRAEKTGAYGDGSFADGSLIWFPSIKDISVEDRENPESNLIAAIKLGWKALKSNPVAKKEFIELLFQKKRALFYRIACHLMSEDLDHVEELAAKALSNFEVMDMIDEIPEYGELLEKSFQKVPQGDQQQILSHLKSGPTDNREYEIQLTEKFGVEEAKRSINARTKKWQQNILVWLKGSLDEKEINAIVEGPIDGLKYQGRRSAIASFVGSESPYSEEEVSAMSFDELHKVLQDWNPESEAKRNEFGFGPSKEGLGRVLTAVVKKESQKFSENAAKYQGLDLEYVEGIIRGFRDASKDKATFSMDQVLDLIQWGVSSTPPLGVARKDDQGRVALRMVSIGFLLDVLQEHSIEVSVEHRKKIWDILEELMKDSDPMPERDEKGSHSKLDDYTIAINSIRGEALQGVVSYAFWVRGKDKEKIKKFSFKSVPEVEKILDRHLLPDEASRAIRAVYGRMFPFIASLDPEWAQGNANSIFSGRLLPDEVSSAAWETYLLTHPSRKHTFSILRPQYEKALENLKQKVSGELNDSEKAFINHLMGLLWNDLITEDDNLLEGLFSIPNEEITKQAVDSMGHSGLYTEKNEKRVIEKELLVRLTEFYEKRLQCIEGLGSRANPKTLEDYGWWFASGFLDEEVSLELLRRTLVVNKGQIDPDHLVLERLNELVNKHSLLVAQCLDQIVLNTEEQWVILGNKDDVKSIIEKLFETGVTEVVAVAEGIIGRLSSRGYTDFRDLKKSIPATIPLSAGSTSQSLDTSGGDQNFRKHPSL